MPLVPRAVPVVDEDVPWEQYQVLDPVGAAQAQAEWWAICQGLEPAACADGPDGAAGVAGDAGAPGTAWVAAAVADLRGPALAGFLDGLPPEAGVDGASVVEAITGFERVIRWAQARQLRWVNELASRREDGRTGWARDHPARPAAPAPDPTAPAGADPAGAEPAGAEPAGAEAAGADLAGAVPAGPACADPTGPLGPDAADPTGPAGSVGPAAGGLRTPGEDLLGAVGEHAAAEVAFALGTTRRAATDLLYAAVTLTRRLPATLGALEAGVVSARAAAVVAEETCVLDAAAAAAVDQVLVERIGGRTVPATRAAVRRAVLSVDPDAAAAREAKARRCRSFDVDRRVVDGMGTFGGYAPIDQVVAIDQRVDALARAARTPGDTRTAGARRMDVVVDLLLGRQVHAPDGTVVVEPPPPRTWRVDVVVSAATLAGHDDEPGDLVGYGPITAPTARTLAGLPATGL
ncbi:MAG: hypothetical protein QOH03_5567, partial [Kribbellaceae bacterium]|nr:hypothetical protein [Kribbellaceae bacterium]